MMIINNFAKIDLRQYRQTNFKATVRKQLVLTPQLVGKTNEIKSIYLNILENLGNVSSRFFNMFKEGFPDLVAREKIKGFVFKSGLDNDTKNIRVFHYKSESKPAPLFLGILDKNNSSLLKCEILEDGKCLIKADDTKFNELTFSPFSENNVDYYNDFLDKLIKKLKELEKYSKNYKSFHKKNDLTNATETEIKELLQEFYRIKESQGLKEECDNIYEKFCNIEKLLKTKDTKIATKTKLKYFGSNNRKRGFTFSNIAKKGYKYNIAKVDHEKGDFTFRISIIKPNGNLENMFFFNKDGRVFKQKIVSFENAAFVNSNFEMISDNETKKLNIKNIMLELDNKLDDFENFVKETYEKVRKKRVLSVEEKEKIKVEKQIKAEKRELLRKQKEEISRQKNLKKQELKTLAETQKLFENNIVPANIATKIAAKDLELNITDFKKILPVIQSIFDTPIEERSSHLIHEQLSNGRIFGGRFKMKAKDGAIITVSKIKDSNFDNFSYYSINIEKDGVNTLLNIDSLTNRILLNKNGKAYKNALTKVFYLTKKEFLEQNPQGEKIPQYILELAEIHPKNNSKKTKLNTIKTKQETIKDLESEITEILNSHADDDIIDLL